MIRLIPILLLALLLCGCEDPKRRAAREAFTAESGVEAYTINKEWFEWHNTMCECNEGTYKSCPHDNRYYALHKNCKMRYRNNERRKLIEWKNENYPANQFDYDDLWRSH